MKTILYLHGFASSPSGRKVSALRQILEPAGFEVVAPDLNAPSFRNLDFDAIARRAQTESNRLNPDVIVGSSLGALVALETSRRGARAPLLLIAPALGFGNRWIEKLPPGDPLLFFHHGEERELPIHRRFFQQLSVLDTEGEPPARRVVVMMGAHDESVPFDSVRRTWERWERSGRLVPGSCFVEIPGGDHGLVEHTGAIAREIMNLASEPSPA